MIRDADEQQHRREHLAQRLLQALRDVVDVVGDAAQQVAALLLVDVAERQRVDLVLDRRPQPEHQPLHDAGEEVARRRSTAATTPRRAPTAWYSTWCSAPKSMPLAAEDAADDDVGAVPEHARAEDVERRARRPRARRRREDDPHRAEHVAQAAQRALKSFDRSPGTPAEFHRPAARVSGAARSSSSSFCWSVAGRR